MFCKYKRPTRKYSNLTVTIPGLKFFKTKSKSVTHMFNMWPLLNSLAHFSLALTILSIPAILNYLEFIICPIFSLFVSILRCLQGKQGLALPRFCTTQASYLMQHPQWPSLLYSQTHPILISQKLLPTFYLANSKALSLKIALSD